VRLGDIDRDDGWAPIRRVLGVRSFGINAWSGREAGPYRPRSWETNRDVLALFESGRHEEAKHLLSDALGGEYSDSGHLLYNLACAEARLGEIDAALDHLAAAVEHEPALIEHVGTDEDLAPLRGDPRFPPDAGGGGAAPSAG
jgi:tetratricopeptide (TPR) repeat protein